jgi:hypothetical protein
VNLIGQDDRIFRMNRMGRRGAVVAELGKRKTEHEQTLGLKKKTAGAW